MAASGSLAAIGFLLSIALLINPSTCQLVRPPPLVAPPPAPPPASTSTNAVDNLDEMIDLLLQHDAEFAGLLYTWSLSALSTNSGVMRRIQSRLFGSLFPDAAFGPDLPNDNGPLDDSLIFGPSAADEGVQQAASFLDTIVRFDRMHCLPRILCSVTASLLGPTSQSSVSPTTQAPPPVVSPPAPPIGPIFPPGPPTHFVSPPAPPISPSQILPPSPPIGDGLVGPPAIPIGPPGFANISPPGFAQLGSPGVIAPPGTFGGVSPGVNIVGPPSVSPPSSSPFFSQSFSASRPGAAVRPPSAPPASSFFRARSQSNPAEHSKQRASPRIKRLQNTLAFVERAGSAGFLKTSSRQLPGISSSVSRPQERRVRFADQTFGNITTVHGSRGGNVFFREQRTSNSQSAERNRHEQDATPMASSRRSGVQFFRPYRFTSLNRRIGRLVRFPRRRRKRFVSSVNRVMSVLDELARPYLFYPYTHAIMMGGMHESRTQCARLYSRCPTNQNQMLDAFNNANALYPAGLGGLFPNVQIPALDAFKVG